MSFLPFLHAWCLSLTGGVSGECLGERQDAGEAVSFVCSTTAFLIEHRILLNFGTDCDCRICLNKYNPKATQSKREDATFKMQTAIDSHDIFV